MATDRSAAKWREAWDLARLLDSGIRVPGTSRRIGWDGLIGLVPGVGDVAGLTIALVVIGRGVKLGAGAWTVARMVVVALVDGGVGALPVGGWLFDFAFKANERNLRTVARHHLDPTGVEAESRRIVLVASAVGLAIAVAFGAALLTLLSWLSGRLP